MKRIVITGSSGYLGSQLVQYFKDFGSEVIGLDVVPPAQDQGITPHEFHECDILSPQLESILAGCSPDALIHAAFVFKPIRDRKKMRRINVEGTRNVLEASADLNIRQVCVVSSATAYGAWPDNPVPLDESCELRARPEFQYSADKGEIESLLAEFTNRHQHVITSWVRPAVIGGPNFDNYLRRFVFGMPFLVLMDGYNTPLQFVHEMDVVRAIGTILSAETKGACNVGPADWSTIKEVAELSNRRALRMPFWFMKMIHGMAWNLRLPFHESPSSFLYYARYPWVVSSDRLTQELGFQFEYSSRETLMEIVANEM